MRQYFNFTIIYTSWALKKYVSESFFFFWLFATFIYVCIYLKMS